MYNLGIMHERGHGVEEDFDTALRWYRDASELGLADAQFNLGAIVNVRNHPGDRETAVRWWTAAAVQSHPSALNNLAILYRHGRGVARSCEKATQLWRAAGKLGHAGAQANLGALLAVQHEALGLDEEEGADGDTDESGNDEVDEDLGAEAVQWLSMAAKSGSPKGQRELGRLLEGGRCGLRRSDGGALKMYSAAAAQGSAGAERAAARVRAAAREEAAHAEQERRMQEWRRGAGGGVGAWKSRGGQRS